jgi:protein TonB
MPPSFILKRRHVLLAATASAGAAVSLLTGCASPFGASSTVGRAPDFPASREYRRVVASHLYSRNSERIFKGVMPPNLYAIGVLQVDIDRRGQVARMHWLRAPNHAPEVVAEIERTVRQAAPYPLPPRTVTYTDTWLWHKSGRFQLDTLTEGQL